MRSSWSIILGIALIVAAIILFPNALLWATSVIFNVEVSYDFWHWLAAVVFLFLIAGGGNAS